MRIDWQLCFRLLYSHGTFSNRLLQGWTCNIFIILALFLQSLTTLRDVGHDDFNFLSGLTADTGAWGLLPVEGGGMYQSFCSYA